MRSDNFSNARNHQIKFFFKILEKNEKMPEKTHVLNQIAPPYPNLERAVVLKLLLRLEGVSRGSGMVSKEIQAIDNE